MTSTVKVYDGEGRWVFNPATKTEEWVDGATVYEGPGLVQALSRREAHSTVAGAEQVVTADHVVKVPWTATDVAPGVKVLVVECSDLYLQGKTLTVSGVSGNELVTCRRVVCVLDL